MIVLSPGKVVLLGEYAVLDGAPAVVVAVDRGVRCEVSGDEAALHEARGQAARDRAASDRAASNRAASDRAARDQAAHTGSSGGSGAGGRVRIELPPGLNDDRFVRAALEAVGAPPGAYRFSDWNPVESAVKVGLGGSAAATVAAVLMGAPGLDVGERYRIAREVHHAVQGSGSGIDIAASTFGGVLSFTRSFTRSPDGGVGGAIPVPPLAAPGGSHTSGSGAAFPPHPSALPPGSTGFLGGGEAGAREGGDRAGDWIVALPPVSPSVVFSGSSAATGPRVQRYLAWPDRAAFVAESAALVAAFPSDPVGALRAARDLLRSMAARAGVDYWTDGVEILARLADQHGGAAKPSGAGGGDIVVALFPDPDARAAYEVAAARAGFLVIAVNPCGGARIAQGP